MLLNKDTMVICCTMYDGHFNHMNNLDKRVGYVDGETYQSGMSVLPIIEARLTTGLRVTQAL